MNKHAGGLGWIFIVIAFGFITNAAFPSIQTKTNDLLRLLTHVPTPTPLFSEDTRTLSETEKATMSGSFLKEFSEVLATRAGIRAEVTGTTASSSSAKVASATGAIKPDKTPPTVKINGGPADNATTTDTNVCFPLWVSDNQTEYTKLKTQASLDSVSWTSWGSDLNYCFSGTNPGLHTFIVRVKDENENMMEMKRTFSVISK